MKTTTAASPTLLREALAGLVFAMVSLAEDAGDVPLWNEGGSGFTAIGDALSLLHSRSTDTSSLQESIGSCLDVMAGIADTAGDVPEWNKGGEVYEAAHFARETLEVRMAA